MSEERRLLPPRGGRPVRVHLGGFVATEHVEAARSRKAL
jgi:hypothetical protein